MTTVGVVFQQSVARWDDRPFLDILPEVASAYGELAGTWSYATAGREVAVLALRYRAAGYGPGHRIGLMLDNRAAFFLHWLAINLCGASVVPLNADLRPVELDYLLGHSGLVLVVPAAVHHDVMVQAAARADGRFRVVLPHEALPVVASAVGDGAECAVLYTSGTTGKPKGCVLNNGYFIRAGQWYVDAGGLCSIAPGQDRLITPLPMTHMNAMAYSTMAMIMSGGCIIPLDRFHPRQWWSSVRASRATIVHYLGVMPSMLLAASPDPMDRVHDVRFGFGAGVDPRHHAVFEGRFGFLLLEAWAMTETGAGAVIIANREPRLVGAGTFGKPESDIEIRIVDEQGLDVGETMPGELLVRAAGDDPRAGFFECYLHDPEATEEAWAGGWFHTGDVVRRDADGNMIFVDRRKNVIRRSGENIAAVEVESVLRRNPIVRDVAVAATPDAIRGEEVLACVVLREPVAVERRQAVAADIVRGALEELSYFKVPGWVVFVDALPLTATQKVQRGTLKALARDWPGHADCIDTRALKTRVRHTA